MSHPERIYRAAAQLVAEVTLAEIQAVLGREGIAVIILKGPSLGHTLYEDPLERPYCDLDLLVRPRQFGRAVEALRRAGYQPAERDPCRLASLREFYEYAFVSPDGLRVELHRAFAGQSRYPLDVEALFKRAERIKIGKMVGLALSPEDLLVSLCIHATKSFFLIQEKHLRDIALLVAKREIDWGVFLERISLAGCRTGSYYALKSAANLFGAAVPPSVLSFLAPSRTRKMWLDHFLDTRHFPICRIAARGITYVRMALALPLIDSPVRWVPILLRYAALRTEDLLLQLREALAKRERESN